MNKSDDRYQAWSDASFQSWTDGDSATQVSLWVEDATRLAIHPFNSTVRFSRFDVSTPAS